MAASAAADRAKHGGGSAGHSCLAPKGESDVCRGRDIEAQMVRSGNDLKLEVVRKLNSPGTIEAATRNGGQGHHRQAVSLACAADALSELAAMATRS